MYRFLYDTLIMQLLYLVKKKLLAEIGTNFTANAEKLEFVKRVELVLMELEKNVVFGSSLAAVTFDNVTAS